MANTRNAILATMSAQLNAIATGAAYYGSGSTIAVDTWRVTPYDIDTELPAINIRDLSDEIVDETTSATSMPWQHSMFVEVTMLTRADSAAIASLRKFISDVQLALSIDETLGGNALRIQYLGDDISVEQQDERVLGATCRLRIDYRTGRFSET